MAGGSRFHRRLRHNLAIGAVTALVAAGLAAALDGRDLRTRVSLVTAYLGLTGIAVTLLLGPLKVLRHRPNPLSTDLRRDVGIWAASVSLVHVAVGLTVHFRGRMLQYFLPAPGSPAPLPIRSDAFGIANHLGLLSGLVLVLLLLLSSDAALRRLGSLRWKRWQRLNYLAAAAMAAHGVLYQLVEQQRLRFMLLLWAILIFVNLVQMAGFLAQRGRAQQT